MEERLARLETRVEHIQSDILDMKADIRDVRGDIKDLRGEMKDMDQRLSSRIDAVKDSVAALALATEKSFAKLNVARMADRVWWLLMSAGLLAVLARAFKWI